MTMPKDPIYINEHKLTHYLPYPELINCLKETFKKQAQIPQRQHITLDNDSTTGELLIMPAINQEALAIKIVTIFPNNQSANLPSISGVVVLFDAQNGQPLAILDAGELTARRTAAVSALASSYLSLEHAHSLLVVGTGRLIPYLIDAHCAVRPITSVSVWGRDQAKTQALVQQFNKLSQHSFTVRAVSNLDHAVTEADIISTATGSTAPLIKGHCLTAGTHLDLVGGYRADMREVDDQCIKQSILFADTYSGVLTEAGDFIQPINAGIINSDNIKADLIELCKNTDNNNTAARNNNTEITLFKSVGTAFSDLAAANLVYKNLQ